MITLLIGDNLFEIERALAEIRRDFDVEVEKFTGSELQLAQLPDILMGVSLFATKRLIVIRGLSENKTIWPVFGDWLLRISDDINLVLIEPKPDKRTSTFKSLKEAAVIREFNAWTDRDSAAAEKWVSAEAEKLGLKLDKKCIQFLVQWIGIDQWQLFYAIEKLSLITDEITPEIIKNIVEPNPVENVFNLFETALNGDVNELKQTLQILEQTEDVYRLSALLTSQVFQLAAVISATKADNVAKDFGIHPYVVSKLTPLAKRLGQSGIKKVVTIFTELDDDMKISRADPWLLAERALVKIANI